MKKFISQLFSKRSQGEQNKVSPTPVSSCENSHKDSKENTQEGKGSKMNSEEGNGSVDDSIKVDSIEKDIVELLIDTLNELGCQPEVVDEERKVIFRFQGESFLAQINGRFIRIWDLPYMSVNVLDTRLPQVIEAINRANFVFGPTMIMRDTDKNGDREITSKMDLIFVPQIPHLSSYLGAILTSFFELKHTFHKELATLLNPPQPDSAQSSPSAGFNPN